MSLKGNLPLRLLKILLVILSSAVGLVLLVLVAVQVFIGSSLLDKAVVKVASEYVDGDLSLGDIKLGVQKSFPFVNVSIKDLLITYPHDRYGNLVPPDAEGRGEAVDTLVSLSNLYAEANCLEFIKHKNLYVKNLILDDVRAFAYKYDSLHVSWDVIRLPESKDEKDSTKTFRIDQYKLDRLEITNPRVVYRDVPASFAVTADFDSLRMSGFFRQDSVRTRAKINLALKNVEAGDLLSTLGSSLSATLAPMSTDALLTLSASTDFNLPNDSLYSVPPIKANLVIPESHISYAGHVKNAKISLEADGEHTPDRVINVDLSQLAANVDGLSLSGTGGVRNLTGRDPKFIIDANASAALQKISKYLPASLQALNASGNIKADLKGSARKSQLGLYTCAKADLTGHVKGDVLRINDVRDSIFCYMERPSFSLATVGSILEQKTRALSISGQIDSVNMYLGESLATDGRNLRLYAQNASDAISDDTQWHPFAGKVTADRLSLKGADSLSVRTAETNVKFTATPYKDNGKVVPYLRLENTNGRVLFRNTSLRIGAMGTDLIAGAQMRAKRTPPADRPARDSLSHRRFSYGKRDSLEIPDYLREKEFRLSDIDIRINNALTQKLRSWTPSMQLAVDRGVVFTPRFPLMNRVSGLRGSFKDDHLSIDTMHVKSGSSDITLALTADGLKRALTRGGSNIEVKTDIHSDTLNVNEILAAYKMGIDSATVVEVAISDEALVTDADTLSIVDSVMVDGVPEVDYSLIVVPANLVADVNLDVSNFIYSSLLFNDLHSTGSMKERCLQITDTRASSDIGSFALDAFYSTKSKADISTGFNMKLQDVTADRVIEMFPAVDEVIPMLKSFKGILDCEMAATSQLDTNMNFMVPTISGMFKIGGKNLVLEDIGSLKKITTLLMFKDRATGWIDDMSVNGVINDNVLEVFPFILSVDRYTAALSGVQNLSGNFDYHISLIKSPVPFKIGVNIFGSDFSNWKYRLGKAKYRTTKIPLYTDALNGMQLNLASSIRNIFSHGVDAALKETKEAQQVIARKRKEFESSEDGEVDILSAEEQNKVELLMIEAEAEAEAAALSEEIDKLFELML